MRKSVEPRAPVERVRARVARDRLAVDVLHHEIRHAGVGEAAVDQARDVGVVEARQHLALAQEQALLDLGIESAAQKLDRDVLAEIAAFARAEKNRRHAALAEQAHEAERADALADETLREHVVGAELARVLADRRIQKTAIGFVGRGKQTQQRGAFVQIEHVCGDPRRMRAVRQIQHRIEQRAQPRERSAACIGMLRVASVGRVVHGAPPGGISVERQTAADGDMG